MIDEEELLQEQHALIHEIAQVLEISASEASVLLQYFSWNKEKLFEGYYADPVKVKHEAGVEFADKQAPEIPASTKVLHDCEENAITLDETARVVWVYSQTNYSQKLLLLLMAVWVAVCRWIARSVATSTWRATCLAWAAATCTASVAGNRTCHSRSKKDRYV